MKHDQSSQPETPAKKPKTVYNAIPGLCPLLAEKLRERYDCNLPPTSRGEGIWKSKWTQDISGDQIEDSSRSSCADSSGSVGPFFIGDTCAFARIRDVDVGHQRSTALLIDLSAFGRLAGNYSR